MHATGDSGHGAVSNVERQEDFCQVTAIFGRGLWYSPKIKGVFSWPSWSSQVLDRFLVLLMALGLDPGNDEAVDRCQGRHTPAFPTNQSCTVLGQFRILPNLLHAKRAATRAVSLGMRSVP